jgi:hypothetical protein
MTSKKKPAPLLGRLRQRFLDSVRGIPATVVASAAGAAGAAIITLGVPSAFTGVMAATQKEKLVAVFSEPVDEANTASSCGSGGSLAVPASLGQPRQPDTRPHEKQVEFWTRAKRGHVVDATVEDETGVGHGAISGFEKSRNTLADFDSISASFDGELVGRGTYELERHYVNGTVDSWWRGWHTFYDCHHDVMLTVPIVVGPLNLRMEMEFDKWLDTASWIDASPAKTAPQRTAAK